MNTNLWVRSQDRKKLVKCEAFYIFNNNDGTFSILDDNTDFVLGTYKTEKDAIKILDYIYNLICNTIQDIMYNMPENK